VSADQKVNEFLRNPDFELLRNDTSLVDRVGKDLGRHCVKEKLTEHQLREVHERLLKLYYKAKEARAKDPSKNWDENLNIELARLKYFMIYQRSRLVKDRKKKDAGALYFDSFTRLAEKVRDYTSLDMLFYLSESVIAYYNWEKQLKSVGGVG
jgi:CRISPR/Cas system CSM-associated protein Csm2 small subunit